MTTTTSTAPLTGRQVRDLYDLSGATVDLALRSGFLRRRTDGLYNVAEVERFVRCHLGEDELEERRSGRRQAARIEQAASLELTAFEEGKAARAAYPALRDAIGRGPTRTTIQSSEQRIAFHEAGHAQAARALGCTVTAVRVKGSRGHVMHDAPSRGTHAERRYADAVIVAAGPIAVDLAYGDLFTSKRSAKAADTLLLYDAPRELHDVVVTEDGDAKTDAATLHRLSREAARDLGLADEHTYARHWLAEVVHDSAALLCSVWPALVAEARELAP